MTPTKVNAGIENRFFIFISYQTLYVCIVVQLALIKFTFTNCRFEKIHGCLQCLPARRRSGGRVHRLR